MTELVRNEMFHYVEPRHGRPLIHAVWELASAIYSHNKIQMDYQKQTGTLPPPLSNPLELWNPNIIFI